MASPAFIYAFDNLGPDRFVELCGLLLGARYRGFLLGGPGPDGGIDSETSPALGHLVSESPALLLDSTVKPGDLTVFQFKHKVTARTGQTNARAQLLKQYRSTKKKHSEIRKALVNARKPRTYVLVTNVEVNAEFRESFRQTCRQEDDEIELFEVVGLDDLQAWVTQDRLLRAQFFPTLFGSPRFNLELKLDIGLTYQPKNWMPGVILGGGDIEYIPDKKIVCVDVMNTGEAVSYLNNIKFRALIDGRVSEFLPSPLPRGEDPLANPRLGDPLNPGQSQQFRYYLEMFLNLKKEAKEEFFLAEMIVRDQVDNAYVCEVPERVRRAIYGS